MKQSLENWAGRYRSVSFWLAVGFGSGLLKPAPGTWGSLAAILAGYGFYQAGLTTAGLMVLIGVSTLLGTFAINRIERETGIHDAPEIVIDEFAGQWVAMLPFFYGGASIQALGLAFILFRVFDIWKPWPIGWLDKRVDGGFGVIVDDLVAGLFALIGIEIFLFVTG